MNILFSIINAIGNGFKKIYQKIRTKISLERMIIIALSIILVFSGWSYFKLMKDFRAQQTEFKEFQEYYADKEYMAQKEMIHKALKDLENKKPVKQKAEVVEHTVIQYVEKETPDDPDVNISKDKSAKIKYEDKLFDIPMKKKTSSNVAEDGTVTITEKEELVIDVTDITKRNMAAIELQHQREIDKLNKEAKKKTRENRILKGTLGVLAAVGIYSLVK